MLSSECFIIYTTVAIVWYINSVLWFGVGCQTSTGEVIEY